MARIRRNPPGLPRRQPGLATDLLARRRHQVQLTWGPQQKAARFANGHSLKIGLKYK